MHSINLLKRSTNQGLHEKIDDKEWWEDTKPVDKPVTHHILEKIYSVGDVKDPVTGKMVVGEHSREDLQRAAKLYGDEEDAERFSYDKAPERGWQEGKRAFTRQKTYKKWHKFKKDDKYGLI